MMINKFSMTGSSPMNHEYYHVLSSPLMGRIEVGWTDCVPLTPALSHQETVSQCHSEAVAEESL